ncbi:MAG: hypothetical protein JST68_18295 [Bacteroidetes bacterium]|nr:hypothetical protein [Bacteroidota bacterium]
MKPKIHSIAFYTLLLAVYGVFFSVESFFNFEGQLNAREIFKYSSFVHASQDQPEQLFKATPLRSSSTHKVRLNKRFHQEDIAPFPVFSVEAPVVRLIPKVLFYHSIVPLPSVAEVHHPLRGPPVVA